MDEALAFGSISHQDGAFTAVPGNPDPSTFIPPILHLPRRKNQGQLRQLRD
jgi:hypothetical protein